MQTFRWNFSVALTVFMVLTNLSGNFYQMHLKRASSITIIQPDGNNDIVSEGNDFATRVLRSPWDMSLPPYPDFPSVLGNFSRSSLNVSSGMWSMNTTNGDPRVNIYPTGLAQIALNVGSRFPIDASRYVLLSFRMCSSQSGSGQIYWFYDQTYTKFAGSNFFSVSSGCRIYVIDLRYIGTNTLVGGANGWNGNPVGLSIDPINLGSNVLIQFDWIRLTTASTSSYLPISWQNLVGTNIEFYVDTNNTGYDGEKIGVVSGASANGTFNWGSALLNGGSAGSPYPLPESLQPGTYYVYALVDGAQAGYSSGSFTVDGTPILSFSRPSATSGDDYATVVGNDPWDLSNSQDLSSTTNIANYSFNAGILNAQTNSSGDPQIYMHTFSQIDTSRYKYLTYRMYVEGTQDIGVGWVTRWLWDGPTWSTTKDIVIYEGWQTYSVDLSKIGLEPGSSGWTGLKSFFRLDPLEVPAPMPFHLDYVMLTADERVQQGTAFPIIYQISETSGVTINLCYDTDQNPANGKVSMQIYSPPPPTGGSYLIYLPLVYRTYVFSDLPRPLGTNQLWNTSSVSIGTYYICADVSDGVNTATWYSDTPIIVVNQ